MGRDHQLLSCMILWIRVKSPLRPHSTNGLPPGHPLCGFLAAIPVKVARHGLRQRCCVRPRTAVERLDRHPVGHEIILAVAVALAAPPDRDRINAASLEFVRRAPSGAAVVPNPLEVAESVLGCLPTVVFYPSPSFVMSGVAGPRVQCPWHSWWVGGSLEHFMVPTSICVSWLRNRPGGGNSG